MKPSRWDSIDGETDYDTPKKRQRRMSPSPSASPRLEVVETKFTGPSPENGTGNSARSSALLGPPLQPCRLVDNYEKLNRIDEGAYGIVYRARNRLTGEIVALKKLKLDKETNGFPVTSLREIHSLLLVKHPNIVNVKEICVSSNLKSLFIVMEFVEHELKSLMASQKSPFLQSEIKTIMLQLLSAVATLHQNWIVHRDLKTSNLLMNNQGQIKVADFGLARRFGSPLGPMTQLVVTLWYRAPELLLGAKEYTTAVDIWSIGCIFGELVNKEPLLPGRSEIDQLSRIFKLLGTPTEKIWPGFSKLPNASVINFPSIQHNLLRQKFPYLTDNGRDLLLKLLTYDPTQRITAEAAMHHPYFSESPLPIHPSLFPTFPSKSSGEKQIMMLSPSAPRRGENENFPDNEEFVQTEEDIRKALLGHDDFRENTGFRLKM
ncbi:kinase-like domain-containing protein, partial [Cladochytrium replicatum]